MLTIEQMIAYHEECAKFAERNNVPEWQEEHEQYVALLRELAERRKEPEIINCRECVRSEVGGCELYCMEWMRYTPHNGYCHRGQKRRTDE